MYKLINKQTGEEHICDKVTVDGMDYYVSDEEITPRDKFLSFLVLEDEDNCKETKKLVVYTCLVNYKSQYDNHITSVETGRDEDDKKHFIFDTETCQKVIATNNPNIDIPKVLDEVDLDKQLGEWKYKLGLKECKEKADKKFEKGYSVDSVKDKISHRFGYVYGIKEAEKRLVPIIMELKSQETHPFSEEDMIEFAEWTSLNMSITPKKRTWYRYADKTDELAAYTTKELLQIWKEQQPKIVYYGTN